jgi:uncharacterized membrane protein YbhN (UPF0104 family)
MEVQSVEENTFKFGFLQKKKVVLIFLIKILIAAGLLVYLVSFIEYNQVISAIKNANLWLISIAFLLSFVNIYLQYSKWRITCNNVLQERKSSKVAT